MSALFFDIDGTILSEITHKIPESALEALHKAQENGHKTFINTGRTICSVPPMIKRISFDGFLCGCGTQLVAHERIAESSFGVHDADIGYFSCDITGAYPFAAG